MDRRILPLDSQTIMTASTIPKPPFSYYITAQKSGGKTTLLLNLLTKPSFYKGVFNRVILISPTNSLDEKLNILKTTKGIIKVNKPLAKLKKSDDTLLVDLNKTPSLPLEVEILDTLDLEWLDNLVKSQMSDIEKYGKSVSNKVLVVLDDSITSKTLKHRAFLKFLLNSRHYNCSTIFCSQSYMLLPRSIRLNNSFLSVFEIGSITNLKQIYTENENGLTWDEWKRIYDYCVSIPYGFLSISYQNHGRKHSFIQNLENFICINNTIKEDVSSPPHSL